MATEDAGCLATPIPSPTRPGLIWHACCPPIAGCPPLGRCRLAGVPMKPRRVWLEHGRSKRGFSIHWEWFLRNSLHDGPITPRRHIDLLLLVLWRPPPAWCLPGRLLTQPGM